MEAWTGFATSAFRNAKNGKEVLAAMGAKAGVSLNLISQDQEGLLGYIAGIQVGTKDPKKTVVWDIGGGSQQFTYRAEDGSLKVIKLEDRASEKFKETLICDVKCSLNPVVTSPNPVGVENLDASLSAAESFADSVQLPFVPEEVIGIGGVHAKSLVKVLGKSDSYSQKDLDQAAQIWMKKTDVEINDPFADTIPSNILLVEGMMKCMGVEKITISPYSATEGALVYPDFWAVKP